MAETSNNTQYMRFRLFNSEAQAVEYLSPSCYMGKLPHQAPLYTSLWSILTLQRCARALTAQHLGNVLGRDWWRDIYITVGAEAAQRGKSLIYKNTAELKCSRQTCLVLQSKAFCCDVSFLSAEWRKRKDWTKTEKDGARERKTKSLQAVSLQGIGNKAHKWGTGGLSDQNETMPPLMTQLHLHLL